MLTKFKLVPITKIEKKEYVGDVFDLTVNNSHSYCANNKIVHNSLCTTRIKTGCGIPTFQSIMDISGYMRTVGDPVGIIADGGIKYSGDVVKCLAAGASAVMVGKLFAGTDESPGSVIKAGDGGLYKIYRGSASYGDKKLRGEETNNIEGEETLVPYSYENVSDIIKDLKDGCRSGFSYCGAYNITELQERAEFTEITNSGYIESTPHGR